MGGTLLVPHATLDEGVSGGRRSEGRTDEEGEGAGGGGISGTLKLQSAFFIFY